MTIVPAHQLDMNDLQILGNNTAEAIRLDHEELQAVNQDIAPLEPEPTLVDWDSVH
tara:strand:- start:247 stop:414 length:168 start_codon:yes stop_codon:yes gene_type:complete